MAPKASSTPKALLAQRQLQKRATGSGLEPTAVLKCTEKVPNAALLIQERCGACHGLTVRDVLGAMVNNGARYSMADLKYDIKHGRLEVLPPGGQAGAVPQGKPRADAPLAGQPLPPASVDEFFKFLQCQLRMELREHTGESLEIADKDAEAMWPDVQAFITPNLGATERWVPYHTVLGVHELFLVQAVHHNTQWSEKQRFQAMFVFRAHCKRDLFLKAQLPVMQNKTFWQDPIKAFAPGGAMEKSMRKYRKSTGFPLITSCFRIIPPRVLKDDDENLVRSITDRTMTLLEVAEQAWDVMKDKSTTAAQKMAAISSRIQDAPGLGETWAKMLTVCVDLAYPKELLLESQCDVGTGAAPPLKCLVPQKDYTDKQQALKALLKVVNGTKSAHAKSFWTTLKKQEARIRAKFKEYSHVGAQANTKEACMSAVTLQVQLCEYRQYRHSVARLKYGLPDDESMRGEVETKTRLCAENFVECDDKKKCCSFQFPKDDKKIDFEVPYGLVKSSKMVAYRTASICFEKFRAGASKQDADKYRDELVKGYQGGEDVSDSSPAWLDCRTQVSHSNPLVAFVVTPKSGGKKFPFQTTSTAAGGILQAERIARLCWQKFEKGASKEDVIVFRNQEYKKLGGSAPPPQTAPPTKKARSGKA